MHIAPTASKSHQLPTAAECTRCHCIALSLDLQDKQCCELLFLKVNEFRDSGSSVEADLTFPVQDKAASSGNSTLDWAGSFVSMISMPSSFRNTLLCCFLYWNHYLE